MPRRNGLSPGQIKRTMDGSADLVQYSKPVIGTYQEITALNNAGFFVPNILRLNPVSIWKQFGYSNPAAYTPVLSSGSYKNCRLDGDIAAFASCYGGPFSVTGVMAGAAWNQTMATASLSKAYAKAASPDFDIGIQLGEMRETLEGLRNPLSALRLWINKFNKLIFAKGGRGLIKESVKSRPKMSDTLNMLSGSWLEWRYGITPLIITIESAIEHLKAQERALEGKLLRTGGTVRSVKQTAYSGSVTAAGLYNVKWNGVVEEKTRVTSRLYFTPESPLSFAERYGFDILSVPGVAWELVHLSFVVDWFLSVGQWLDRIKFNLQQRYTVVGSCTSQKTSKEFKFLSCQVTFGSQSPYNPGSGLYVLYEQLERRINQTLPLLPAVNPAVLSLQRKVDALTLLWQRLPRFRR